LFSQRQEWNKIFVDSHLQVTKSYYVFMVRGNGETNSRKEKCCVFFCGGEENATTWGSVARRKGRHAKNCGKQYGKGMSTDKLEGKSSAVFYHREDKSATTLRKKFFIARGRGGRDHFGKRIMFLT